MAELDYQYLNTLVKRTLDGDSDSFAELYAATYERQYQFAYYFLKDIYLAQDAVTRVYSYALEHLMTLTDPLQMIDWLDQIDYRICYQILYHEPTSTDDLLIWELPYRESSVFLMYEHQNMSVAEIALAIGDSKQAVRALLTNAKRKLHNQGFSEKMHKPAKHLPLEPTILDSKSADILLDTVLEQRGYGSHKLPVTTLVTERIFRKERYVLQKVIVLLALIGLLVLPVLFYIPSTSVTTSIDQNNGNKQYNIHVSTLLRVHSVEALLDGVALPIYETSEKVYTIEPHGIGTAQITVTLENGQFTTEELKIAENE